MFQLDKPIHGDKIQEALDKAVAEFDYPFYYNFHFGFNLRVMTDNISKGEISDIDFYFDGWRVFSLGTLDAYLIPVRRPANLIAEFRLCLEIHPKRTHECLGCLCWM